MASRGTTIPATNGKKCDNSWGWGLAIIVIVVILIIGVGCWGTYSDSGKSAFANIKSKFGNIGGSSSLKDLDIVMFMSPTCPWCKKMMDVLNKEGQLKNMTVIDMTKPEGAAMAKQFGADKQPVPSFISRKNKTGTVGYRETVAKLVEDLKQKPGGSPGGPPGGPPGGAMPQRQEHMGHMAGSSEESEGGNIDIASVQNLQIVLFAREGCPWCTKAKDMCSQNGVMDVIQVVDITTPEGQSMAGQMLPPGTSGVPSWVSMATKKSVVGFKPLDQLIQELQ